MPSKNELGVEVQIEDEDTLVREISATALVSDLAKVIRHRRDIKKTDYVWYECTEDEGMIDCCLTYRDAKAGP